MFVAAARPMTAEIQVVALVRSPGRVPFPGAAQGVGMRLVVRSKRLAVWSLLRARSSAALAVGPVRRRVLA